MKARWREMVEAARELVMALPPVEVGAFYLDAQGCPVNPRSSASFRIHPASLGGALPRVAGACDPLPSDLAHEAEMQVRQNYEK